MITEGDRDGRSLALLRAMSCCLTPDDMPALEAAIGASFVWNERDGELRVE